MNNLLRPRIWPSFLASSGVGPCDVPFRYGNQHPVVTRWYVHLRGLATAIHEISGLVIFGVRWTFFNLISRVCQRNLGLRPVWCLWILDFDMHSYLSTTETRRARRKLYSCPIGSPAYSAGQASDRARDLCPASTIYYSGGFVSTVGPRLKSFRRRRRLFSLAVVSRPGKKQHPLCTLCLCGKSPIRLA
jgi:hypothetical protein